MQQRAVAQEFPRLPDVQDAQRRLLHEEHDQLQPVPDRVDVQQVRVEVGRLLSHPSAKVGLPVFSGGGWGGYQSWRGAG